MVVTHYSIRKLHPNTRQISFSPLDILLGSRALIPRDLFLNPNFPGAPFNQRPAWQSCPVWAVCKGEKMLGSDPHMQSLTLIINYGCFCFFLPQPLTTLLLAARGS